MELIKSNTFHSLSEFDRAGDRINLVNGHLHFPGGGVSTFTAHYPYNQQPYLSFIQLPLLYDVNADCLEIDQFLTDIFGFERVPDIYEMISYFIMPTLKYQKAFILYGPPKTGKTSFINLIQQFVGGAHPERLISHVPLQDFDTRFQISNLRNKLLNIFDDLRATRLTSQGRFRMSVTNPTITAETKYVNDHITWRNVCKNLFTCNQLPSVGRNTGEEFWRRWKLYDCFNEFDGAGRDLGMVNKRWSESELSGLLNACILAWYRLEKRGHFRDDNTEYVKGIWQMDIEPARLFVDDKCEIGVNNISYVDTIWHELNKYRKEFNAHPISKTMLTQSLQRISDVISKPLRRKGNVYVYEGIKLKEEILNTLPENGGNSKLDTYFEKDFSDPGALM